MAKWTTSIVNALKLLFETGDKPSQADFYSWLDAITQAIQEHGHSTSGGSGSGTGDGAYTPPWQQTKIVAKSGGQYTTVQAALDAITDAGASKRYLILVAPGVYTADKTAKEYIDIMGMSRGGVVFTGGFNMASHMRLSNVSLQEAGTTNWNVYGKTDWQIANCDFYTTESNQHVLFIDGVCTGSRITNCDFYYVGEGGLSIVYIALDSAVSGLTICYSAFRQSYIECDIDSTIGIFHCAFCFAFSPHITNSITTPYNVIDQDV